MTASIEDRFSYYPPTDDRRFAHHEVRYQVKQVALFLDETLPEGREKSLALTKLEEAMFWSNAAIARQGD